MDLAIETNMLSKRYGRQTAINRASIHVKTGRIYGLLGRNGAGKTTIMKMMLGLASPTAGEIQMFGKKLVGNQKEIYPRIGSIVEVPGFYPNLTGTENLKVFAKLRGMIKKDAVKEALEKVNLPYNDKKKFAAYSLGMKQRLGIANAILNDPELLILDEPTNGLDPIGIAEVRAYLRKLSGSYGKTILISSHILSEIALMADDVGIIHEGVLLEESSIAELNKRNEKYVSVEVSDVSLAARVLEKSVGQNFEVVSENALRIYGSRRSVSDINRVLVEAGVEVSELIAHRANLEDYFKRITGGVGIA
ncbi:MAG: ABC transporter ATP-binding protein [Clostridiales bacterium]|jgi:bacitracin transport system ATP-binding protein|nr:ABC transporter ATP-binding protein [Clostridiales bacterium]